MWKKYLAFNSYNKKTLLAIIAKISSPLKFSTLCKAFKSVMKKTKTISNKLAKLSNLTGKQTETLMF